MMNLKINDVKAFLKGQKHVKVAYLFGSRAKGKTEPLSDFDIAVLLDKHKANGKASIID
jgi:predicted nucleotidyltransferase